MSLKQLFHDARNPPEDPTHLSFKGRAVLVTGANSDLGYQAALKYAAQGPLILDVRTQEKGETAKASIVRETGTSSKIMIETVDLSTFTSVQQFCDRVCRRVPELHVALLCAGLTKPNFIRGSEGFEMALQVNVLSTALMALLLLPKLRETAAAAADDEAFLPHVTFLNSHASHIVSEDAVPPGGRGLIEISNDADIFHPETHYYVEKLAGFFTVRAIAEHNRKLGGDGSMVVVNAVCPGLCRTGLGSDFPLAQRVLMTPFQAIFSRSTEEGSRSLVSATGLASNSVGKLWFNDKYLE